MTLYPQARAAVAEYVSEQLDADGIVAARAEARAVAAAAPREAVDRVDEIDADGVRCRLYRPAGATAVTVHLHGGGFVFHDIDVHDAAARRLANRSGTAVLSVDYRRPPEHRFPAAPDDVDTVLGWLGREAAGLGLSGPWFVHGDSAGGNLALVAALRNPGRFAAVALTYPFLDPSAGFDSYRSTGVGFDPDEAAWYWDQYAATEADLVNPDLAPLLSDRLGTLPPTLVVTAEHDPLRDEGEELARRLAELGVVVTATRYLGQVHGFWRQVDVFDAAEPLTRQIAGFLGQYR
ncbi:alpha/beta hydrolase [Nocardioides marmoriginsengisoli]|uniref:Alpha/beta hydrolase n=1 Tax=Nocardioides marmoriginsengisoli TaxID=661483 RepID=A0A3N0CJS4_9ACTN|nr:alpha/beta hydrolase [Nocardioides marmoriginsengisoli]RNL63193.1 alpha/beta hydrolase [Nocardioides marmoriginsengisoli]